MMQAWRGFGRLSARERWIVVQACAALAATRGGLRICGFPRWKAILEALSRAPASAPEASAIPLARTVARMEAAAARHLFRTSCLERSLALWWLLRRRGVSAELRVGARKQDRNFEAHAWVEVAGAVLSETDDTHLGFRPFEAPVISVKGQTS